MKRKVLKFGGSSIGSPEDIRRVADIILGEDGHPAVVFSAFQGVTDRLIQMSQVSADGDESYLEMQESLQSDIFTYAKALIPPKNQSRIFARLKATLNELEDVLHGVYLVRELTSRTQDVVMSFGERVTADLICEYLKLQGAGAEFVDARNLIKTDRTFGAARVDFPVTNENIREYFGNHSALQVVTGFIGSTASNEITTLGRSGSDYTATIIGAALESPEIEIWTDVNGIMTADPKKVPAAFSQSGVSYEEAMEMSHFGARVIHPSAMQPAFEQGIPIRIRNTFDPGFPGTVIAVDGTEKEYLISGISSIEHVALLRVQGSGMMGVTGIAARLFGSLAEAGINIILITQASSEHTICFAVAPDAADHAKEVIEEEFSLEMQTRYIDRVVVERELSVIAAVGENMRHTPGIAGRLFRILGDHDVNVVAIAQGSSELNISAVISRSDEVRALRAIHTAFFDADRREINLFQIGAGKVGGELLNQVAGNPYQTTRDGTHVLKLAGLADGDEMVINREGINLAEWENILRNSDRQSQIEEFIREMKALQLPGTVFIDCTASNAVADRYLEILSSGIPVVTANKKANSGDYSTYRNLAHYAKNPAPYFLYETNVGAGLPVINTLRNLMYTGDTVHKIQGVLSGTLSYIFNAFSGEKPFSEIVRDARERGYTEPDPRDDLDGMDVARKLLILARECGRPWELDDIRIDPFLPERCFQVDTIDQFFEELTEADEDMERRRKKSEEEGKRLRYIASLEGDTASVSLDAVDRSHPFYHLHGSDNILAVTTDRYNTTPLVIQGPGAGPEVTAAGLFSDILRAGTESAGIC